MGIDDSGSIDISMNDAVLPNNWYEITWVKHLRPHGVQMSKLKTAGKLRTRPYTISEGFGNLCKPHAVKKGLCGQILVCRFAVRLAVLARWMVAATAGEGLSRCLQNGLRSPKLHVSQKHFRSSA